MSDENVGYGSPPKHTQYKKGESGNSKGRPKKKRTKDSASIMNEILDEPAVINVDGEQVRSTKRKAFLRMLLKQATEGKPSAIKAVLELMQDGGSKEDFEPGEFDEQLLKDFVNRQLEDNHDQD